MLKNILLRMSTSTTAFEKEIVADPDNGLQFIKHVTGCLPDMLFVTDLANGRIVFLNDHVAEYFGQPIATIYLKGAGFIKENIHQEDQLGYLLHLEACRLLKANEVRKAELRVCSKFGIYKWFHIRSVPFKSDSDGLVSQLITVCRDIDEQRTDTIALQQMQNILDSFLESAISGHVYLKVVHDQQSSVIDFIVEAACKSIKQIVGLDPVGSRFSQFAVLKETESLFEQLKHVAETGEALDTEIKLGRKGIGGWYHLAAIRTGNGVGCSFENISEKKAIASALGEAEKLSVNSQYVRTVLHDIRNPLTSIKLAAAMLAKGKDYYPGTPESPETLTSIVNRNAARIETLLKKLLELTAVPVEGCDTFDLANIMDDAVSLAIDRAILAGARIEKSYSNGYRIAARPEQLKTAFVNIIVNAIEAIKVGNGIVHILIQERENEYVVVIKDNGHGIAPEAINHIFDAFYTCKPDGIGLGLASTRLILQNHSARIDVSSEPGYGTSFLMGFPKASVNILS